MSTEECRQSIVEQWDHDGNPKDWKRLSKKAVGDDVVREFENKKTAERIFFWSNDGDDEDGQVIPWGEVYFFVTEKPIDLYGSEGWGLAFNPKSYWDKEKCLWDQHYGYILSSIYGVPEWIVEDELAENQFAVSTDRSREEIVAALNAVPGLSENEDFSKFLSHWE